MSEDPLRRFGGVSFGGVAMAQFYCDLYLWEMILNDHPEIKAVCEIGSWKGGLSLYLEAQCRIRGIEFWCCDVVEPEKPVEGFQQMDIWRQKDELIDGLRAYEELGPIILFCDNGNKPRELREFTPHIPSGSLVMVHDWGTETLASDIPDWLEETLGDFCDELGSITRVFTLKGDR